MGVTEQEQLKFIETIVPIFQKYAKKYGYKIVSAPIAQACMESGYGTSYKAKHGNNILGMKYRPNRVNTNNGYFEDGGSEQNKDGTYTLLPSSTAWYAFDNYDRCIEGYYQFISIPRYANVRPISDPLTYLQTIIADGYGTSLNYPNNAIKVVQKWNLTKYDNFKNDNPQPSITIPQLQIIQKTSTHNTTACNNRKIEWIVLHYTAGVTSTRNAAQNTAHYFSTTSNQASADFIVDDETAVQYNPDPKNYYCWAVGGQKYPNTTTTLSGQYYGQCKNSNSISIEMCSRKKNTSSLNVNDNDWYITEKTENMAIQLTRYLMQLYKIDKNHIIMHHQVTGKWCPQPWCKNEAALVNWRNFLSKLAGSQLTVGTIPSSPAQNTIVGGESVKYIVEVLADTLNVRSGPGTIYQINKTVSKGSKYTIIEQQGNWGRLISGAGWISLIYTRKIDASKLNPQPNKLPYLARVIADTVSIREEPNNKSRIMTLVHKPSIYTIVEEQNGYGLLKSFNAKRNGWIELKSIEPYTNSGG